MIHVHHLGEYTSSVYYESREYKTTFDQSRIIQVYLQIILARSYLLHFSSRKDQCGECQYEPMTARSIRDTPVDFISLNASINSYNAECLRTCLRLFRLEQDGHPVRYIYIRLVEVLIREACVTVL